VARMTGIPSDTLRMWERRYGFPKPMRSSTKIRAYSRDDLERLQLITRALAAGHRPGQVVPLPRPELERIVEVTADPPPSRPEPRKNDGPTAPVAAVLEALSELDIVSVQRLIRQSVATLGARSFLTDFAHPLAVLVGELWASGKIDIRHEHLATEALSTQIRILLATYEDAGATPTVLLASLPDEHHYLGAEMTALYLALERAQPRLLGPAAPVDQIVAAANELEADVVGLTLVRPTESEVIDDQISELLQKLARRTELWIGGGAAANVRISHPKLFRASSWDDMATFVHRLRRRGGSLR
jgi:methanogenic corrinoid protein MtbC1